MKTELFDYQLPEELIAQRPAERRDFSRMLVLDRQSGECEVREFGDITEYLEPGDLLVSNNTKVMRARLYGRKNALAEGALFEALLLNPHPAGEKIPGTFYQAMLKPGKRAVPGTRVTLLDHAGNLLSDAPVFTVVERLDDGTFVIEFDTADQESLQEKFGHIPLPPYIKRGDEGSDFERYQTIFAKVSGAVAAPTAGLHFTGEVLRKLEAKGVRRAEVTLHVGAGTFKPVSEENILDHKMHSERFVLSEATADLINATRAAGKKVVAVGTTTVRTLESCADENGVVHARTGATDIFLYPPYQPRSVDMLITNFHLPKSTLLMLVSCFADREKVLNAYKYAIQQRMRFYSYGDCMLFK
ncbi:MAG: tRNA preQ1(34) S-adenosylmethionine ribosyltransferase-isomerase QueA [Lentisphaerae bacterium]|nr:tRNA preQ1(34) S-adenosylmethionine ribosyltransferase-isomerase QueA [Lentisphaerota bacterium]